MGTLTEIALSALLLLFLSAIIGLFIKGSRPPQPLEISSPTRRHALANATVAIFSPGASVLVFYLGVWIGFTNNPIFLLPMALPLVNGAYCGRRAFRSKGARVPVRAVGLLAVIVCVPSALCFFLFLVTGFFGRG